MHQIVFIAELIKHKKELLSLKTGYLRIQSKEIKEERIKNKETCLQDPEKGLKRANLRVIGLKEEVEETGVENLIKG